MSRQQDFMQTNAQMDQPAGVRAGEALQPRSPRQSIGDALFTLLTGGATVLVLLLILAIFVELFRNSWPSIQRFGLGFLISTDWISNVREKADGTTVGPFFGAATSIYGTLVSTLIAMLLAVPVGLITALFLVELAPPRISKVVSTGVELLAAIPSIIYGMWGFFIFAPFLGKSVYPFLQQTIGTVVPFKQLLAGPATTGLGMMTAGIILSIMILPFITAVARDVFNMVPAPLKESAYGMGATTWEVTRHVTIRYGFKGVIGAALLGLGRAIGETMAVTFVIGNSRRISASLMDNGSTITSMLANKFQEAAAEPLERSALIELGLILFLMTFLIQAAAHMWLKRVSRNMGVGL